MQENSVFSVLNAIDCNEHVEKKGKLSYLSWAWAWREVKAHYPKASYTIYESPDGWNYFTDGRTCWVKVGVTIEGLEHIEYLPIMDNSNQSIPLAAVKSVDVNKSIQRSLTKACARHGLGLYIYAGEDLPDSADQPAEQRRPQRRSQQETIPPPRGKMISPDCTFFFSDVDFDGTKELLVREPLYGPRGSNGYQVFELDGTERDDDPFPGISDMTEFNASEKSITQKYYYGVILGSNHQKYRRQKDGSFALTDSTHIDYRVNFTDSIRVHYRKQGDKMVLVKKEIL